MVNEATTRPLPNRLRVARAERGGVSQWVTADGAGIAHNRYWRIEAGRVAPTEEERARLAAFFGVAESKLFPRRRARGEAA